MRLAFLSLFLPVVGFSCAPSAPSKVHVDPGRYTKTIKIGEMERSYVLRVPKQYDNKTKLPLVILLHGWTSNANQVEVYTQFGAKADKEGFILVSPDGTIGIGKNRGWNSGILNLGGADADDVALTETLIDSLEKDMYVDDKRVFVAGHSNGAMMAYQLGGKLGSRIAAIAVVAGTIGTPRNHVEEPKEPVSAIVIHGKADETVPYDDTSKALLKTTSAPESAKWWAEKIGCGSPKHTEQENGRVTFDRYSGGKNGAEVELISIRDGGHMWPNTLGFAGPGSSANLAATDLIWDFFRSHPKR